MKPPNPAPRLRIMTGASALVAGLAWVAKDIGGRVSPDSDYFDCNSSYDYLLNAIDTVAFLALAMALVGLHRIFRLTLGKRALIGLIAATGFTVAGLSNLFEHCAGLDALGFPYVLGLMLGMLLVIVAGLMLTRVTLPTWCTWLLVIGTVVGILFANQGGLVVFGLSWLAMGLVLIRASNLLDPR